MRPDPEKVRTWQRRGAERYAAKQRQRAARAREGSGTPRPARRSKPARNDGPWRNECIARYGDWCRSCAARGCQMDHMKPRSQGGQSDVRNGLPLCRSCHERKTAGTLQIRYEWLDAEQVTYLAEIGWVAWDAAGQTYGEGYKHFAARVAA